jgi:hypothetical protein
MGFVIWYQVTVPGAGLRVSNDVLSGDYILDADIVIDLASGAAAGTFRVALADLPASIAETMKSRQPLDATISLGYLDDLAARRTPVLAGVITHICQTVRHDGTLVTELRGYDQAGHRLRATPVATDHVGTVSFDAFVADIATQAGVGHRPGGLPEVTDRTLREPTGLVALRLVAEATGAPLVISDGAIHLGATVGVGTPVTFTAGENIVALDGRQETEDGARTSLELVVLGDPALRAGQPVLLQLRDTRDVPPGTLRTEQVRHVYSSRAGYTCRVTVVAAEPGRPAPRPGGVHRVVERLRQVGDDRPVISTGEVVSHELARHAATLRQNGTRLHNKPVSSPFAFHNCGLMVPVLPGMRAVLAHEQDAIVGGFLWDSERRPRSQSGDWWLCLPTELDGEGLPAGKGVNDLTDAAGSRVIQAKGLRITVGDATLPAVGDRPEPPAAGALVIEHESATTVTVDAAGAVTIATDGKDITFTNGSASITLTGDRVRLQGSKVEVA